MPFGYRVYNITRLNAGVQKFWAEDRTEGEDTITVRAKDKCVYILPYDDVFECAKNWLRNGFEILKENIVEVTLGEDKGTLFIVTPPSHIKAPIDPLAVTFDFIVKGYGFFTTDNRVVDLVHSYSKGEGVGFLTTDHTEVIGHLSTDVVEMVE